MRHIRFLCAIFVVVLLGIAARNENTGSQGYVSTHCGTVPVKILKQVKPNYPADAKANNVQGLVRLTVMVDTEGLPGKVHIVSGPPELIPASLEAVKQWRFKPLKLNGKAVRVEASVDFNYVIPPKKDKK